MECHDAQAAISVAIDGGALDPVTLDAAKQHCRECVDCASFVRALNALKRAPLPVPPAGLTDSVMAGVRREAAAARSRAEAEAASDAAAAAPATAVATDSGPAETSDAESAAGAAAEPQPGVETAARLTGMRVRPRPRPAVLAAWVGAAALLVASAGTVGILGVRLMSQGQTATSSRTAVEQVPAPTDAGGEVQAPAPTPESAADSANKGVNAAPGPNFIAFNAIAYRYIDVSETGKDQFTRLGTITTSLGGGALKARDVMGATGATGVYVENDQGELLEFQPLQRTFEGRTYQLRSAELPAFGMWPTLPADIAQPTSANGSPTFFVAGTESSGVRIYRLTSSTSDQGIAVAPGSPGDDPAAGNPGWTWWTPVP